MLWRVIYETANGEQQQYPAESLDGALETARSVCDQFGAGLSWVQLEPEDHHP